MNKVQATVLFVVGAAAGAGALKGVQSRDPAPVLRVHAVDLRAGAELADGGFEVRRVAYGTLTLADGGIRDIGQARRCDDRAAQPALRAVLEMSATDCEWP